MSIQRAPIRRGFEVRAKVTPPKPVPPEKKKRRKLEFGDSYTWRLFLVIQDFTDIPLGIVTTYVLEWVDGEWVTVANVAGTGEDQDGIQWLFHRENRLALVGEQDTFDNYISEDGGETWTLIGEGNGWTPGASVLFGRRGKTWRLDVDQTEDNTVGTYGYSDEIDGAFVASYSLTAAGGDWWLIGDDSGFAGMHRKFDTKIVLPYARYNHVSGDPATHYVGITTDGGENWTTVAIETDTWSGGNGPHAVWLPNNTIVVALTFDSGEFRIWTSTDNGASFQLDTTLDSGVASGNTPLMINVGNTVFVFSRAGEKYWRKIAGGDWEEFDSPSENADISHLTQYGNNGFVVADSFGSDDARILLCTDAIAAEPEFEDIAPDMPNEDTFIMLIGRGQPRTRP